MTLSSRNHFRHVLIVALASVCLVTIIHGNKDSSRRAAPRKTAAVNTHKPERWPRSVSSFGLAFIQHNEGKRITGGLHVPYTDDAGNLEIGYGHRLTKTEIRDKSYKGGITEKRAKTLLEEDIKRAERTVNDGVDVSLTLNQYHALVDFTFNVGARAFLQSTLLKKLNNGSYSDVPAELSKWTKGKNRSRKQFEMVGLQQRRNEERALWNDLSDDYVSPSQLESILGPSEPLNEMKSFAKEHGKFLSGDYFVPIRLNEKEKAFIREHPIDSLFAKYTQVLAFERTLDLFVSRRQLINGVGDATRHCFWAALLFKALSPDQAQTILDNHEDGQNNPFDDHNNSIGRQISLNNVGVSNDRLWAECLTASQDGRLHFQGSTATNPPQTSNPPPNNPRETNGPQGGVGGSGTERGAGGQEGGQDGGQGRGRSGDDRPTIGPNRPN